MISKRALSIFVIIALVGGSLAIGVLIGRRQGTMLSPPPKSAAEEAGHGEAPGEHGDEHGAEHGAEVSDLDRPVAEMWAASCEHDIPQHQCDECRYELGMVKLAPEMFGAKGLILTTTPSLQSMGEERSLPGEVQMDESRTVHVASPLAGSISRSFAAPGQRVATGAPLFELDSPEVAEARSSYLKGLASLALARKTAERENLLFAKKITSAVEVQEAEARLSAAETEVAAVRGKLRRLGLPEAEIDTPNAPLSGLVTIRAPRGGQVSEGHANLGEYVEAGKELLTLTDPDAIWIVADLRDQELATLTLAAKGGVKAEVTAAGRAFPAHFEQVLSQVSEETRTPRARFRVTNTGGALKPGMFVSVRILLPGGGATLVVPKVAVLADAGRTFVFVHHEGDFWVRRPVTLGKRSGAMVEVTGDLTPTQKIIADGSFLLKSDVLRSKMGAGCAD
ncbi:MAG: efflux RND transporter periplasmic adaptor subunit [Desulfobulbaceae bacterium]|nr:efflux RND transporter periplasmic adaptor subunit [Desulfobulbaceae bacterium]